ncbi:MAG: NADH-quinone oxidoreductase subunit K [Candidatus Bathyarchaeia archaeon]
MIESQMLQVFAAILFFSGFGAVVTTKNLVKTIMGFQVMVWGVNLSLFASGLISGAPSQFSTSLIVISISIGASVEALALSFVIVVFRRFGTLNPWEIRRLAH